MRLKVYFGKVCAKHPELKGERGATNRRCAACNVEDMRAWRRRNKAEKRAYNLKWRKENSDYQKQRCREWHAANREHQVKRCRDYYVKTKEQRCAVN